jgi:hypothetical protein
MGLGAPPELRERWWNARREERAVRVAKRLTVLAAVLVLLAGAWAVKRLQEDPVLQLATACAQSPFGLGTITEAGGPAAVGPDHDAMAPYQRVPALTARELGGLRTLGSRANDREMSTAAFRTMRAGAGDRVANYARLEALCADRMDAARLSPAPKDWFRR